MKKPFCTVGKFVNDSCTYIWNVIAFLPAKSMRKKTIQQLGVFLAFCALIGNFFDTRAASPPPQLEEMPAFPGAKGFGSSTTHGRGGTILEVTNLNDDGVGSLRDAITKPGRRIVVFKVSGTIDLSSHLIIDNPFIYIAGQTSVNGIQLRGAGIKIRTHDVLIRGLMIRPGDESFGARFEDRTGIIIHNDKDSSQPYNIVIDHNSIQWGTDEVASTYRPAHDITFSHNIIAEGLNCTGHPDGCHSMGLQIGRDAQNISIYANLIANNAWRNPIIGGSTTVEVINNLVYAWGAGATIISSHEEGSSFTNVIGNYYDPTLCAQSGNVLINNYDAGSKLFYDDWLNISGRSSAVNELKTLEYAFLPSNIVPVTKEEAYQLVLNESGARGDATDIRIKNNVINRQLPNKKCFIDSQSEVGGWETIPDASYTDTDHDGMPDQWEQSNGLNPNDPMDGNTVLCKYTAVEQYLNSFYESTACSDKITADFFQPILYFFKCAIGLLLSQADINKSCEMFSS